MERQIARQVGRRAGMVLDHERLDVYAIALDFLVFANDSRPSGGSAHTRLDVGGAEPGRGRGQALEGRQAALLPHGARVRDRIRGSARCLLATAAHRRSGASHRAGKAMVVRVVSMLIKLAMSFEDARPAPDESGGA